VSVGDGPRTGDEAAVLPSSVAADARTGAPSDTEESGGREALRDELALILAVAFLGADYRKDDPGAESTLVSFVDTDGYRSLRPLTLGEIAACVDAAGYRRVVEDDTAVRRVAEALAAVDGWEVRWPARDADLEPVAHRYLTAARAAVRALREDT